MSKSIDEICKIPLRAPQQHILNNLDSSKFHVISAPTGVGKSFIAAHIAKKHGGAMILTPDRGLQAQYEKEMNVANLWGRAHYKCGFYNTDCETCADKLDAGISRIKGDVVNNPPDEALEEYYDYDPEKEEPKEVKKLIEKHDKLCEYAKEKSCFKSSSYSVTGVELCFFGIRNKSECLIIDEAHNLVDKLTSLSGSKISCDSKLFGNLFRGLNQQFSQARLTYEKYLNECCKLAKKHASDASKKRRERKQKFIDKLSFAAENSFNFGYEINREHRAGPVVEIKQLNFKGAFSHLIKDFKKVYLMSATLPDVDLFCELLGIERHETNIISVDSPFSPQNIKVFSYTKIDLSSKSYESNMPAAVAVIDEILDHESKRGIIHCTSFRQINDIRSNISRRHYSRLIFDDSGMSKEELLQMLTSYESGVIVSASAYQGVDLKGDLGTFSVTFKAPYPVWSTWMQAMNLRHYDFYNSQALSRFIQGIGRCVRSESDKAHIYTVDKNCARFVKSKKLPSNVRNAHLQLMDRDRAA